MNLLICEGVTGVVLLVMGLIFSCLKQFGGGIGNPFIDFILPAAFVLTVVPLAVFGIYLQVSAAVKCSSGEDFRYPYIFRLLK